MGEAVELCYLRWQSLRNSMPNGSGLYQRTISTAYKYLGVTAGLTGFHASKTQQHTQNA